MSDTLVITSTEHVEEKRDTEAGADENYRVAELVVFENCKWGIGIKICGGCSIDGEELHGVYVKRILPGGLAETQGGLQKGDQILEVNGDSLEGVTYERAASILRLACFTNHVEMVVCRDDQAMCEFRDVVLVNRKASLSVSGTQAPVETQHKDSEPSTSEQARTSSNSQNFTNGQQEVLVTPTEAQGAEAMYANGVTPKLSWRGHIPTMSSTPNNRGITSTAQTGSSGSPGLEFSPVGGPVLSLAKALSHSSVFHPNSTSRSHVSHNASLSRKLSIGPHERVEVEKLTSALHYLGLEANPEKELLMRSKLHVDANGTVLYGDVVEIVRDVFRVELENGSFGPSVTFMGEDVTDQPPAYRSEMNGGASGSVPHQSEVDMEELRQENDRLKMLLEEKEDEVQAVRKEQREMRSKVHLAAKAQKVARDMEHDYEEVVHLLEGEIAQLKMQLNRQVENDPVTQRRLAVLTCQLRKAESEKSTLKVATEKLLQFAENVHETFSDPNNGAASRPLAGAKHTGLLSKNKQTNKSAKTVANKAHEIVKSVRSLIDNQPLPFGWEESYTADGIKYYINHLNQVTTWTHPVSNVSHLPPADDKQPDDKMADGKQADGKDAKDSSS